MPLSITAKKRTAVGVDEVRAAGEVPAVIYGGDRAATTPVSVSASAFAKLYENAGSSLVDFQVEGEPVVKVLIQDVQVDPVKGQAVHVDFRQINMNKEMSTTVELVFVGESAAVKGLAGTLAKSMNEVNVTCLPKNMVSEIEVDLSLLKTFDDSIRIKDIVVPAGITIDEDQERVLATVTPPLTEEELKAMEDAATPVDLSVIEVEKKGKEEVAAEPAE